MRAIAPRLPDTRDVVRLLGWLALANLLLAASAAFATAGTDLTLRQFMAQKVDPTAKIYFGAVQYLSDENGERDVVPQTGADWERIRRAAVDLQAQGKALQSPTYSEGRNPNWTEFSQSLVEVGRLAQQAAKDTDPDKVFEVAGMIYAVCDACHSVHPTGHMTPGGGGRS